MSSTENVSDKKYLIRNFGFGRRWINEAYIKKDANYTAWFTLLLTVM